MNHVGAIPLDEFEDTPKKPLLAGININDLMKKEFDPLRWAVPGYIAEGFSVLAGRQKLGKTWLALDMAIAVATGGCALGSVECDKGDVLYLDLENGQRRVKRRLEMIFPDERRVPDLSRMELRTGAVPQLDKGLIDELEAWRLYCTNLRMVVIDVLQRVKPAGTTSRNSYENDYSIWSPLQNWAMDSGIAVVGLHHTRKGGADDPLEALSGSNGLSACADATLLLDRDQNGTSLYVRGRDIDEKDTAIRFDEGLWTIIGDAATVRRSDERQSILTVLTDASEPMTPREIAIEADMKRNNVDRLLGKMVKAEEVLKAGRGRYIHPGRIDLMDASTLDPGKNGKKVRNEDGGETNAYAARRDVYG